MKLSRLACGILFTAVLAPAVPAAAQNAITIRSATSDPARIVIEGTGASMSLLASAAIHFATVDGRRVTEITTPATVSLPVGSEFTLRLRSADGSPHVAITLPSRSGDEVTELEGREIVLGRFTPDGPVVVRTAGLIRSRRVGH